MPRKLLSNSAAALRGGSNPGGSPPWRDLLRSPRARSSCSEKNLGRPVGCARGASSSVALAHSVNADLLRRWVAEAEASETVPALSNAFVAVPVAARSSADAPVRIEVRRGALTVSVQWPSSAAHE